MSNAIPREIEDQFRKCVQETHGVTLPLPLIADNAEHPCGTTGATYRLNYQEFAGFCIGSFTTSEGKEWSFASDGKKLLEYEQQDPPAGEYAEIAPAGEYAREVILTRASDMRPEPITWLWNEWLACGKLHILGGAPGTGKTTIALNLAATVTTGGQWPDGTQSPTGNVAIWSGEDDARDTLLPRLMAAGADCTRVHFIDGTREGTERQPFDPARDVEPLRRELAEIGNVRLLIVDPIVSAVTGDSHKNAEVRRSLQPLADLAGEMDCAVLGLHHFAKGTAGREPAERLIGSQAFAALARVVLVAAKSQPNEDGHSTRIFCRAKSNIGRDDGGFEYDLQQGELPAHPGIIASAVQWGDALEGAARELLAQAEATDDDGGARTEAEKFLENYLREHGATRAEKVREDAEACGFKWRTIQNARARIRAASTPAGFQKGNIWSLPVQECKDANSESA